MLVSCWEAKNYIEIVGIFSKIKRKTVCALRVNKIKVFLGSFFFDNLSALESEKESKKDEKTVFCDYLGIFQEVVNKIKVTSRRVFTDNLFGLESEKK